MSTKSSIEWTEATWNPITGCTRISPGCARCYAIRDAYRLGHNPHPKVAAAYAGLVTRHGNGELDWTGEIRSLSDRLTLPLHWHTPRRIFVNSMGDLFHESLTDSRTAEIRDVFRVMALASWHQFQVLTKRAAGLYWWMRTEMDAHGGLTMDDGTLTPLPLLNVWLGVSVEARAYRDRIDDLRRTPAAVRFLSLEPLLEDLGTLDLAGIDLVIVGGESGPGARPMEAAWVRAIRDQCVQAGVALFFKQWGGVHKKQTGRLLDGRTWDEMPPTDRAPRQLSLLPA